MSNNCTAIAAALSANFLSTTPYDTTTSSLTEYLDSNGVLLSMCFPGFGCALPPPITHLAASWINTKLGLKVLPANSNIALILDPKHSDITCIYPTDAGTDSRDNKGCGAINKDPTFGSTGATKLGPIRRELARYKIRSYKNFNFGRDTPWLDIDCQDFFSNEGAMGAGWNCSNPDDLFDTTTTNGFVYQPYLGFAKYNNEAIMGHAICTETDPTPHFGPDDCWLYTGPFSWPPSQWQEVMDAQLHLFEQKHPTTLLWNEIVLKLPREMGDVVSAVTYVVLPDMDKAEVDKLRRRAQKEAIMLGHKPLLKVELTSLDIAPNPLFVCDEGMSSLLGAKK